MIIICLKGGLGNQLFQYAVGRYLAEIHKTEVKMDISAYDYDGPRKYFLGPFNFKQNLATPEEIKNFTDIKQGKYKQWLYKLFHNHPKLPESFVRWNSMVFNPDILKLPDNIYLEGYFISEKYFIDAVDIIRKEFGFRDSQTDKNKDIADEISSCISVSIHVRRGDYVSDSKGSHTHATCSLDYYHLCINELAEKLEQPHFFIFSDDPLWARENLELPHPAVYVDHNPPNQPHEDLRLMSQCNHNIIANSTFSWWGAWLNNHEDKIVYVPKKWFTKKNKNDEGIIPLGWTRK